MQVSILLTRYPDNFSKLFRRITRNSYSHVSIGVDGPDGVFYSLVTKGFHTENPYKHQTFKGKQISCRLYNIDVPMHIYEKIKQTLEQHLERSGAYKYSYLGTFLCLMNIALKRENRYFCSQFVTEVLSCAKAVRLSKESSLYLPDDFMHMDELKLNFAGTVQELMTLAA